MAGQKASTTSPSAGHLQIISKRSCSPMSNHCFGIVMATQVIRCYTQLCSLSNPQQTLRFYCKKHNHSIAAQKMQFKKKQEEY